MTEPFYYIANLKLYFDHKQSLQWLSKHAQQLEQLAAKIDNDRLILCPSFTALSAFVDTFSKTSIAIGAQNVAQELNGAYSGQESAQTLKDLGCTYGIIGHSEQRHIPPSQSRLSDPSFSDENALIARKTEALLSVGLTPIMCIGETLFEREQQETEKVLKAQLLPLENLSANSIIIAYEPIWAIGSGILPTDDQIKKELSFIKSSMESINSKLQLTLLYGGSISQETSKHLKKIDQLDGFLIGKASTDVQELEKIVL